MAHSSNGPAANTLGPGLGCKIRNFLVRKMAAAQSAPRRVSLFSVWNVKHHFAYHLDSGNLPAWNNDASLNLYNWKGKMCCENICVEESPDGASQKIGRRLFSIFFIESTYTITTASTSFGSVISISSFSLCLVNASLTDQVDAWNHILLISNSTDGGASVAACKPSQWHTSQHTDVLPVAWASNTGWPGPSHTQDSAAPGTSPGTYEAHTSLQYRPFLLVAHDLLLHHIRTPPVCRRYLPLPIIVERIHHRFTSSSGTPGMNAVF